MKIKLLKQLMFLSIMLLSSVIFAQSVSGTVTGDDGPLPGVNIIVKGTQNGVSTDFDGNYSIDDVGSDAVLEFSFIGFVSQDIAVNGQTVINVQLLADAEALDEVVVIGYGTTTKKDATGSVESIRTEDFNRGVAIAPQQLLQGRIAGVNVTSNSGEPGGGTNIRVRGTASVRAGSNPLIVIDGVPLDGRDISPGSGGSSLGSTGARNPLNFINSEDIESISVLKDASATAIYGSRGANGVILITTKRGFNGAPTVGYSTSFSTSSVSNQIDVLNGDQYRSALSSEGGALANDFGDNVDAFDAITRTGTVQTHNLSISGGGDRSTYRVGLGYLDEKGVIENSGLKKYTSSLKSTFKFFKDDRLKIDVNVLYSFLQDERAPITDNAGFEGSLIGTALFWNPTLSLFNSDGTLRQGNDNDGIPAATINPLALLAHTTDNTETSRIVGSVGATFKITDNLNYKFNFGVDRSEATRRASFSRDLDVQGIWQTGRADINSIFLFSKIFEHTLNFNKDINDNFNLDALVGYSYQSFEANGHNVTGTGIDIDPGNSTDFLAGFANQTIGSFRDPTNELQSYFGRANLSFYNKYLFTVTFRADGSSKFGENNQYGYFPSAAFAWKLAEEDFIPDFFDDLKLRLGWGITGNQEFPAGSAQERFAIGSSNGQTTATLVNVPNPDLQWETSSTFNVGIDYAFFNNRLYGAIDYFNKDTEDLLFQQDAIQPAPATKFWINLPGNVRNSGVEFSIAGKVIEKDGLSLDLGFNISFIDNELTNFPFDDDQFQTGNIDGPGLSSPRAQRLADNQPLFVYKLAIWQGFDTNGNPIYSDGNGGSTTDANLHSEFVGDPNPDIILGFNANFRFMNWDLTANLNGAYGADIYNNTLNGTLIKSNLNNGRNITPNLVGNGETVATVNAISTRYLESGDYLRLSNLTVGYNFTDDILPDWIANLRLYATGQNLFVITPYSGFDPEVNTNKEADGIPSFGIEYQPYPKSRIFTFGLNVTF